MQLALRAIAAVFVAGLTVGLFTHGALAGFFSTATLYIFIPALRSRSDADSRALSGESRVARSDDPSEVD